MSDAARRRHRDIQQWVVEGLSGFRDHLEEVTDALVVPPSTLTFADGSIDMVPGRPRLVGGALTRDRPLRASAHQELGSELMSPELIAPVEPTHHLIGRWLYLRLAVEHFGHFMTESLGRAWALAHDHGEPLSGAVIMVEPDATLPHQHQRALELNTDLTIHVVDAPTLVDRLIVPRQESPAGLLMIPSARQVDAMRDRFAGGPRGTDDTLFVSRAGVDAKWTGRLLGGKELESRMASSGMRVIRPEELTLDEQLLAYRGARTIVLDEGSAIHAVAVSARADATVVVLARRPYLVPAFEGHLSVHLGDSAQIHVVDTPGERWLCPFPAPGVWVHPEIPALQSLLAGIVPAFGQPRWGPLPREAIDRDLAAVALAHAVPAMVRA